MGPAFRTQRKLLQTNVKRINFSEEPFIISNSHLFCSACRESVSLKHIIITHHSQSTKHKQSKERVKVKEKQIADKLVQHNDRMHFRGETFPQEQQVYHIKVVTAFLKAGVPLNKIESFRDILEENAYRFTDR